MSKKYFESWPSELGTLPMTNWNWFPASLDGETWYTNWHLAMTVPPIRLWPAKAPKGMSYRVKNFVMPPAIPIPQVRLDRMCNLLEETGCSERSGKAVSDPKTYRPGIVHFKDDDGTVHAVARHYHALVMKKFPLASPFGGDKNDPIAYREADNTLVAILMPIYV